MSERIENLTITVIDDADGRLFILEQDSCGNIDGVALHSIHVRYLAEKLGLTNLGDPHATQTIASLTRRIRVLADRIDALHDYLMNFSDTKHADFTWEQTYSKATLDIADEFCAELDHAEEVTMAATTEATHSAASPINQRCDEKPVTQSHDAPRKSRASPQQPLL